MSDKLAEAYRLEQEARMLRDAAHREERQRQMQHERDFEKNSGIDAYTSDDYCGLVAGSLKFYYGYEYTVPERDYDDDDQETEWAFVVWENGNEVLRMASSQVHPAKDEEPLFYLAAGIGHWLKRQSTNG